MAFFNCPMNNCIYIDYTNHILYVCTPYSLWCETDVGIVPFALKQMLKDNSDLLQVGSVWWGKKREQSDDRTDFKQNTRWAMTYLEEKTKADSKVISQIVCSKHPWRIAVYHHIKWEENLGYFTGKLCAHTATVSMVKLPVYCEGCLRRTVWIIILAFTFIFSFK